VIWICPSLLKSFINLGASSSKTSAWAVRLIWRCVPVMWGEGRDVTRTVSAAAAGDDHGGGTFDVAACRQIVTSRRRRNHTSVKSATSRRLLRASEIRSRSPRASCWLKPRTINLFTCIVRQIFADFKNYFTCVHSSKFAVEGIVQRYVSVVWYL